MTRPGPDHDPARDPTMTQPDDNAGSMGQERGIDGSRTRDRWVKNGVRKSVISTTFREAPPCWYCSTLM